MQNNPAISVIIPNYNRADKLRLAIESVLSQSYPVAEILVCDDNSNDHSEQVVSSFPADKVKWIPCGANGRPAIPRNVGIRKAASELLAFLDNDDSWQKNKLELQMKEIQKGFEMVCSNAMRVTHDKATTPIHNTKADSVFDFFHMLKTNQVVCSSVLVKKDAVLRAGLFPESPALKALEDYALWLRLSSFTEIRYLQDNLVNYTDEVLTGIRKDSLSTEQQMRLIHSDFVNWYRQVPGYDKFLIDLADEVLWLKYQSGFKKRWLRLLK